MSHYKAWLGICVMTVQIVTPISVSAQTSAVVRGEVISVVDRVPVAGAMVVLGSASKVVFTDDHGFFEFENVPTGVTQLRVVRLGFAPISGVAIEIEEATIYQVFLQPEAVQIEGVTAEVRSSLANERRESGRPVDVIGREELEALSGRMGMVLDVLRAKGPPRLQISAVNAGSASGSLVSYCVHSTRRTSSPMELGEAIGGCLPALLSLDGTILFEPTVARAAGKDLAAVLSAQASEMLLTLPPESIERVRWLTPAEARFRFGEAGKFGALLVTTREARQ